MKYMGSKRRLLASGLEAILLREGSASKRFLDPFAGSAAVVWFAARSLQAPVLSADLQHYSGVLANAVLARTEPVSPKNDLKNWFGRAQRRAEAYPAFQVSEGLTRVRKGTKTWVKEIREAVERCPDGAGPVWRAYAGFYFSPIQAIQLDALYSALPSDDTCRDLMLAGLIQAASKSAAAPGHTAQPFSLDSSESLSHVWDAWDQSVTAWVKTYVTKIAKLHAMVPGLAVVQDAAQFVQQCKPGDLVFLDPPYTDVQYSRFYHVLETVARGSCGEVTGVGRYPPVSERPQSKYSRRSESATAFTQLLGTISERGARVILTFPVGECGNGLTGDSVRSFAASFFDVKVESIASTFSTLGGKSSNRGARKQTEELVLVLTQKVPKLFPVSTSGMFLKPGPKVPTGKSASGRVS